MSVSGSFINLTRSSPASQLHWAPFLVSSWFEFGEEQGGGFKQMLGSSHTRCIKAEVSMTHVNRSEFWWFHSTAVSAATLESLHFSCRCRGQELLISLHSSWLMKRNQLPSFLSVQLMETGTFTLRWDNNIWWCFQPFFFEFLAAHWKSGEEGRKTSLNKHLGMHFEEKSWGDFNKDNSTS